MLVHYEESVKTKLLILFVFDENRGHLQSSNTNIHISHREYGSS